MNEYLASIISALIGGGIFSGVGGIILQNYLNRRDSEMQNLKTSLEHLKKERIEKIETQIIQHISGDCTQRVLTVLDNLSGSLRKMEDKSDRYLESIATLTKSDQSQQEYINNLSRAFREHFKTEKRD